MASNSLFIIPGFFLHFPNESLGLKEMGKFLWEGRENGKALEGKITKFPVAASEI